ncbi:MAG: biotin--[Clostridia bacterium]|nr:biotin--[acetyl-CoA-carboxylase] ligase [Clostridia bacterium]
MKYIYLKETESTNKYAKKLAKDGASEFTVVIADKQTGGYGRMGRSFHSPDTSGLYMSIILRPRISPEETLYITTAAAAAVSQAIEEISGKETGIKWVNDIFIDGKKVCGILTESGYSGNTLDYAILGIGVNIYTPTEGFPDDIRDIAGGIFDRPVDVRDILAKRITERFSDYYKELEAKNFLSYYRKKNIVTGKKIMIIKGENSYNAKALSIDDEFRLIVEDENKRITALDSGEISIRM